MTDRKHPTAQHGTVHWFTRPPLSLLLSLSLSSSLFAYTRTVRHAHPCTHTGTQRCRGSAAYRTVHSFTSHPPHSLSLSLPLSLSPFISLISLTLLRSLPTPLDLLSAPSLVSERYPSVCPAASFLRLPGAHYEVTVGADKVK